jgi:hypothetical protein
MESHRGLCIYVDSRLIASINPRVTKVNAITKYSFKVQAPDNLWSLTKVTAFL